MNIISYFKPTQSGDAQIPKTIETPIEKQNSGLGIKIWHWYEVEAGKNLLYKGVVEPVSKLTRVILNDMQTGDPIPVGRQRQFSQYINSRRDLTGLVEFSVKEEVHDPYRLIAVAQCTMSSDELTSRDLEVREKYEKRKGE